MNGPVIAGIEPNDVLVWADDCESEGMTEAAHQMRLWATFLMSVIDGPLVVMPDGTIHPAKEYGPLTPDNALPLMSARYVMARIPERIDQ